MKIKWLDRRIAAPGPYLCLCLSESEFNTAIKQMGIAPVDGWIKSPHADATTHHLRSPKKGLAAVICLSEYENRNPIEVAGLLVHEAVHVWQEWCDYYGEINPGKEQEAYGVQAVSQELMAEFSRRMSKREVKT